MAKPKEGVKVSILNRDFIVACREEERGELEASATYLDKQMRVIQRTGKVVGIERCAIMAALNISHELLSLREKSTMSADLVSRIDTLRKKIDTALAEERQMTI